MVKVIHRNSDRAKMLHLDRANLLCDVVNLLHLDRAKMLHLNFSPILRGNR